MRIAIALLPVVAFLGLLTFMDSFKLVRRGGVLQAILMGGLSAFVAATINVTLLDQTGVDVTTYSRYIAPVVEELAKGVWLVFLIRRQRVAFLVDSAILGFAIGAGFALYENVTYLTHVTSAGLSLWFARGCGTAILHGATTASFAVIAKNGYERRTGLVPAAQGLLAAALTHSLFNHFVLPPVLSALVLLATLPLLLTFVFNRSEKATRAWLGSEFDGEVEMLQSIMNGGLAGTRTGTYLESLKARFPGEIVADMLCLLQIHLELGVRAKGILMAREAGLDVKAGEDVAANLKELTYLEGQIGRTGLLAMKPILALGNRELWEIRLLQEGS